MIWISLAVNNVGQRPMAIALLNAPNTNASITGANEQTAKTTSKFPNLLGNAITNEHLDLIIEESPNLEMGLICYCIKHYLYQKKWPG